jgi:hypothetical protein
MKSVKLLGLTERVSSLISNLRRQEISTAEDFRLLGVYTSSLGNYNLFGVFPSHSLTYGNPKNIPDTKPTYCPLLRSLCIIGF